MKADEKGVEIAVNPCRCIPELNKCSSTSRQCLKKGLHYNVP